MKNRGLINLDTIAKKITLVALSTYLAVLLCSAGPPSSKSRPVEVWCVGDDGLTVKFRDALESAFEASTDFKLSSGKKVGTLIVTIPTNVGWKQVGTLTQVFYVVELSSTENQSLGNIKGSCWEDNFKCTVRIVERARLASRKIPIPAGAL